MIRPHSIRLHLLGCLLLAAPGAFASGDSTCVVGHQATIPGTSATATRSFQGLDLPDEKDDRRDVIVVNDHHLSDTVLDKRAHAHALLEKVLEGQRFLETLDAFSEIELPVGIVKAGGTTDYSILVDRIRFTKEGAVADIYVSLAFPQTGSRIAFHGEVPLSAEGGVAGNARVFLLGDHRIGLNDELLVTLRGTDRSYVEFDCGGFLGIHLDAELEFSTDLLVPEDEQGKAVDRRLKVSFTTYTETLHDIILNITLPPFQLKALPGFGFHVTRAHLDWSDQSNPEGIAFPEGYTSPVVKAGLPDLWQGIYLQEAEIRLPASFARRESKGRVSIGARDLILDDQGFTGNIFATHLITDGDMSGWGYTLDRLSITLTASRPSGFSLEGLLSIPVVRSRDGNHTEFKYVAHRSAAGQYVFSVGIHNELRLDLWAADVKLFQGSRVVVTEKQGTFFPSAHLHGELTINLLDKSPGVSLSSIRFEDMVIDSEAPYFRPGTFGFGKKDHHSSISKYPVVLSNITLKSEQRRVGLAFDLMVNISGKPEEGAFSGKGGLVVWGVQEDMPRKDTTGQVVSLDRDTWSFEQVELSSLKLDIKIPKVVELAGSVRFFDDDETYGAGFKGSLKGSISAINVEAEALFGNTETFRYWYADALVELKTGVPIFPGVLSAFGFGGGYYSKMKQGVSSGSVTLGRPPSGITYVPDENTVGIRAIVLIGTPRPEAMRGDVSLEASINQHGGINSLTLSGNANFMSSGGLGKDQIKQLASAAVGGHLTEKLGSLKRGQVYGSVKLHFDNINDIFHGNMEIFVNVAGGMVRGVSEGNKAGWAVLHFEKRDWYIHIGTPDQPLGLEVARIFKSKSYFMLGKNLPGSPPPPPQVSEVLGNVNLDYMRDMNALESGMGIAFGLHFLVDTGDLRFLMFYGRFSAGTGLDFMLKDYGNEYHCAGSSGSIGINGWYANGQAYAFVMGKIGIKVNLAFYKGTYDILSIGAATVLQAKGPNPFWMKGTVGGYYKILGGLIKGKCRFELTIGEECKPVSEQNLLEEVRMIADISPASRSTEIDVFNTPQVAFNIPVGEIFEITDMENKRHSFRAVLDEFSLVAPGGAVKGELVWNGEKDVVAFDPSDILPQRQKLVARARLSFQERVNGSWLPVKYQGRIVSERAETTFETGNAPTVIPQHNVTVSYPLGNQVNFLRHEYPSGFIQLKDGQPYLFQAGAEWIQKIRWTDTASGEKMESDLTYDQGQRRIYFNIPKQMQNGRTYNLAVINLPKMVLETDHNVKAVETAVTLDASGGDATLTTHAIEGTLSSLDPQVLYQLRFRTSAYNTFVQKMKAVGIQPAFRIAEGLLAYRLKVPLSGSENLDGHEIGEWAGNQKLVHAEAIVQGNNWYERYVYPVVYEGYPLLGWMKVLRSSTEEKGVPPVRDVAFGRSGTAAFLPLENGHSEMLSMNGEYLSYDLGQSVTEDFRDLQRQAVNYVVDFPTGSSPRLHALIMSPIPYIRYGQYKVQLSYIIPGLNVKTSRYDIKIVNPIRDGD